MPSQQIISSIPPCSLTSLMQPRWTGLAPPSTTQEAFGVARRNPPRALANPQAYLSTLHNVLASALEELDDFDFDFDEADILEQEDDKAVTKAAATTGSMQ